jgi:PST family polysaccharide transporter
MDIKISNKTLIKNSLMLYIMYFAQILFPLITLPYLTRVLSLNAYGVNVYVNTTMSYVSIIIEFGFMLSATKDIVSAKNNKEEMGRIVGDVISAKLLLALVSFVLLI